MKSLSRLFASLGLLLIAFAPYLPSPAVAGQLFDQINLVTDNPNINSALQTDPNLKNAWGISYAATSPFWVSDNGTGLATLYRVDPTTDATTIQSLVVSIPGNGTVTGQVFNTNNASAFNRDLFLFVSEDGTIAGWRGALGTTAETLVSASTANVYKGSALATTINGDTYLYAANFRTGAIDVIKGTSGAPNLTGNFVDPNIPAGYAPFDIRLLNGRVLSATTS